jgi:D-sedoheptulose 7-phosphate isomerase
VQITALLDFGEHKQSIRARERRMVTDPATQVAEHQVLLEKLGGLLPQLRDVADRLIAVYDAGGRLFTFGNGGSAADAQHLAAEFLSRFLVDRRPLPAVALTTDTSVLTAVGNDYGFEHVFERQVRGLGRPGDVLLAISTSGRSPNVIRALEAARDMDMVTIGFSGAEPTAMRELCRHFLAAPARETAVVQQVHMVAGHAICALVERALLP